MSAHTPGPWRYRVGDQWSHSIVTDHGLSPDETPSSWAVASVNTRRDEHKANARLIAAAPELLEALIAMVECDKEAIADAERFGIPFPDELLTSYHQACAAITKATGGQP